MTRNAPLCLLIIFAGLATPSDCQEPQKGPAEKRTVEVRVDPRVELVSIVFRLAGNPEYSQGRVKSYLKDIDTHFQPVRQHEAIRCAAGLRAKYGVSFDACMSIAVHMRTGQGWGPRFPLEPRPEGLDGRWREKSAETFLADLSEFVKESRFDRFLEEHRELYETTAKRMETLLGEEAHLEWFDQFFGARPEARFAVIPALVNGGSCYGPHVKCPGGREEYYCILGVWKTDWTGQPAFDATMIDTIIHEFCHSYANAIIDRHEAPLRAPGEAIFAHVADAMQRQAYGAWKTMLYESLVRASVVRYLDRFEGRAAAQREVGRQNQRGFVWVEELSELLEEYEQSRTDYPTLDEFAPRIVEFFDRFAKKFVAEQAAAAASRPKVVSTTPESGDQEVDPALSRIRVEFDRPMRDKSWSMCGWGESLPETTGQISYDESRRVWTAAVRLKADHEYRFSLNSRMFHGFKSADGVPLEPVEVHFKTKGPSPAQNR